MSDTEIKRLKLPLTAEEARSLKLGESVILDGEAVGTAGHPTHKRLYESLKTGTPLLFDMKGGSLFHMGSLCRQAEDGRQLVEYMNPTTSTRFNDFLPDIVRELSLTSLAGKGGVDMATVEAMRDTGCVYFSMVGGASALLSRGVTERIETGWNDLIEQFRLSKFKLESFGPLTVTIDAWGNSLYDSLQKRANDRMADILADLDRRRAAAAKSSN